MKFIFGGSNISASLRDRGRTKEMEKRRIGRKWCPPHTASYQIWQSLNAIYYQKEVIPKETHESSQNVFRTSWRDIDGIS